MNLFSFIDKYGNYTFDEVAFTEVDNIIMSMLSYLDLEGIVSSNRVNKRTIQEVGDNFFRTYSKEQKNIISIKNAIKVFRYIKDTKRYKDLLLYNYVYKTSGDSQFGALTIELNKKLVYVSFEGTDHLIGGWKEDFMLSYMFPVMSQKRAINYVNRNFLMSGKKIILGGHSKGGNLALVAGMYANIFVRKKIVKIYNNDGPGLLLDQIESKNYLRILSKLVHMIPNYSIVGIMMRHGDDMEVVRSFRKSAYSHDPTTWVVNDLAFERSKLSTFSEFFDKRLLEWLMKYDKKQRKSFFEGLFMIFERVKIDSLIDIMDNKKLVLKVLSESKELDNETKTILRELIFMIFDCFKDASLEDIRSLFNKKVK